MEKSDITLRLVSELVATQFPSWAGLAVRPVPLDGWDNTTFRLGNDMLVRLPSAERYVAQVEKEHHWLPRLAGHLPLPIPRPLARGVPGSGYPFPWSVYRWLSGEPASVDRIQDLVQFAADLAAFLAALYRIDPDSGPDPGPHNFFRGGPVATYDAEARAAIAALTGVIDARAAGGIWDAAVSAPRAVTPVWVHGDVAPSNLLVVDGHLSAVIDFGCSAVGDPACDIVVAWTFFTGESCRAFRAALALDDATGARLGALEGCGNTRTRARFRSGCRLRRASLGLAAESPRTDRGCRGRCSKLGLALLLSVRPIRAHPNTQQSSWEWWAVPRVIRTGIPAIPPGDSRSSDGPEM